MRVDRYTKSLDELVTDLLVATLFETERPPRGVSGLVDWRLNGFISNAILKGSVKGMVDELVLLPLHQRLPARRLLLVGLGKRDEFTLVSARHIAYKIGKTMKNLAAMDAAIYIPPANDEREPGDTERMVMEMFRQAQLPDGLLIRWLIPPVEEVSPAFPNIQPGAAVAEAQA